MPAAPKLLALSAVPPKASFVCPLTGTHNAHVPQGMQRRGPGSFAVVWRHARAGIGRRLCGGWRLAPPPRRTCCCPACAADTSCAGRPSCPQGATLLLKILRCTGLVMKGHCVGSVRWPQTHPEWLRPQPGAFGCQDPTLPAWSWVSG